MKTLTHNTRYGQLTDNTRLILSSSVFVAVIFALVFFIAKLFHLESKTELRFINYVLLFPIVYSALKKSYNQHDHNLKYFSGFGTAFLICALGQLWYSIMFFIYLHIDHQFMIYLFSQFPRQILYPELSIAFILLTEGVSIGVIVALTTMQYFKKKQGRWASTNRQS